MIKYFKLKDDSGEEFSHINRKALDFCVAHNGELHPHINKKNEYMIKVKY